VRHSRVSVPIQCHILLRCARGLNRSEVSYQRMSEQMANGELGASQSNSAFRAKCLQWHGATQGKRPMGSPRAVR
jgi:hypothetical protein